MANLTLRREPAIIGVVFFLAPFITLVAPLTTVPALIVLSGLCIGIALIHGQSPRELFSFDLGLALFSVVTVYLLINATWSLDLPNALNKVLWFGLVVAMTFAASRAVCLWNERQTTLAVIAFLAGVTAGLAFILFQVATDQGLTRLLYNWLPVTRPDSLKTLVIEDGKVTKIAPFELNRNVAVMLLMLWPALLCLSRLTNGNRRRIALAALFVTTALVIMLSEHETSKVGLIGGSLIFLAAWRWPTFARRGMLIVWCLAFVLVVPLTTLLVKEHLEQAEWLPYSARSRITLWAYTAEKIPEAPFFGIGLTSTRKLSADRALPKRQEPMAGEEPGGRMLVWKIGPHAHNEFLQTWYELGAVGVILLLAAGCTVIGYIGRLSAAIQPFMLAQFVAFFVMAAFSWGMWQSWLMALTGLAALYAALAASFARAELPVADELTRAVRSPLASGERAA